MTRLAQKTEVSAWVIFKDQCEMNSFLRVLFHRFDDRGAAREHDVHDVGPSLGTYADAMPTPKPEVLQRSGFDFRVRTENLLIERAHLAECAVHFQKIIRR